MLLALGAVGGIGYVVFDQFAELSTQLTRYTSSMRRKVAELRMGNDAAFSQLTRTVDRVTEQLDDNAADLRRAQPVRVVPPRSRRSNGCARPRHTIFEPIASAVIVIVLVAFMLGQREDLRDRFIRLIGSESVSLTTRLMDEAALSRQPVPAVADADQHRCSARWSPPGLYWIGVPYAALWGGFTAVLRFVPYVGTLLSALMPATLAFATFPGWAETLQTLALFLTLDLRHRLVRRAAGVRTAHRRVVVRAADVRAVLDLGVGSGRPAARDAADGVYRGARPPRAVAALPRHHLRR